MFKFKLNHVLQIGNTSIDPNFLFNKLYTSRIFSNLYPRFNLFTEFSMIPRGSLYFIADDPLKSLQQWTAFSTMRVPNNGNPLQYSRLVLLASSSSKILICKPIFQSFLFSIRQTFHVDALCRTCLYKLNFY